MPIPSMEEALAEDRPSDGQRDRLGAESPSGRSRVPRVIVGEPASVREKLEELADAGEADELMVTTNMYEHADRRRSCELLAAAFELSGAEAAATPGERAETPS